VQNNVRVYSLLALCTRPVSFYIKRLLALISIARVLNKEKNVWKMIHC